MATKPDLKGSSFALSVLQLTEDNVESCLQFLHNKVKQAPAFFTHAPLVIDIEKTQQIDIDFASLRQGIVNAGMIPVGITGCKSSSVKAAVIEAGFAVMSNSKNSYQPPAELVPTKVIRTPIRSGQQVYAKDTDLVILSHVSAGAEVIADGSIHIHGTCRGRAIAGANGQQGAKIICQDLQAELVSIAGNYYLSDQINSEFWQQKVILSLQDETLHFEKIS
ncbi:septum site-determining protein MinC [Vibrio rumoiensis]|uniref:Probable septum site-determining protein MinC n=1 Tax=Vibrio rumoiensis 1S-45 TaxID=1188252 RepID=A0A1E5E0Q9_9VIBR|nr:septum site-determining protein MinC [Vibrio rumoiensis]OEF24054.1 septum site-determining protein MinC [Vibrio rumoiensis 1S-45]